MSFSLAHTMIIVVVVGLLIGAAIGGRTLINNVRTDATIAQVVAIDAATASFRDMYKALPGDMTNPGTRLPNCTAVGECDTGGNGNGFLDNIPVLDPTGTEGARFFVHLSAAGLLKGLNPSNPPQDWGSIYPETKLEGTGFHAGWAKQALPGEFSAYMDTTGIAKGLYLVTTPYAWAATTNYGNIRQREAFRIDNTLDDGHPATGRIRAGEDFLMVGNPDNTCVVGNDYAETLDTRICFVYMHLLN